MHGPVALNPEQQRAVDHGEGPLLVLAGAGTGKTRVLVHRIAQLVKSGVRPHEVLAVTFSNKAAGEMRERLRHILGGYADRMWIGTFHGTCARLLRIHGEHIGLPRDFTIFDDDDQKRVINALLKEHGLDDMATPQAVRSAIDRAKNRGEDPIDASGRNPGWGDDILKTIYPEYKKRLAREHAVDFNDLLLEVVRLMANAEIGPVLATRFRHVLVDEFQDTNRVQYKLVKHFARGSRNLTVVGDDDQSIYSWRGAEPKNLLEFDRDYPDATIIKLEQNYRSSQRILDAANGIIARNISRRYKALWSERQGGEYVLWEECADEREEADFIARAMRGLVQQEGRSYGDLAVLYRTHAQSRVLEEQLRRYRIEYRIVGGVSFFQRKEIKDALAYVRLVLNPAADSCFERVVNTPTRGIGKTTLDRVRNHARRTGLSFIESAQFCVDGAVAAIGKAARKKLAHFLAIIEGLREVQAAGASVAEMFIQTVERSSYRQRLEDQDTPESRDRLANLAELVAMASDYDDESAGEGSLSEFDERISLSSANDSGDGRGSASVTLMTIHAAKGLEFPVVFLCGLEDGLFPSIRERDGIDEVDAMEEERRLAYVAMTRAMDRLVLTSARMRRHWGEIRYQRPSRFLDELPVDCMAMRKRPERDEVVVERDPQADSGNEYQEWVEDGAHHSAIMRPGWDATEEPRRGMRGGRKTSSQGRRGGQSRQVGRSGRGRARNRDEFDQRTFDDDMPTYDLDDEQYGAAPRDLDAGDTVSHDKFGEGRVIKADGSGKNRKLLIAFDTGGLKTVMARFVERV